MYSADDQLDVRGYNCPIPLLRAKKALAAMRDGQVLKVLTTDAGAEIDFKVFADATGHRLLALGWTDNVLTILIEKAFVEWGVGSAQREEPCIERDPHAATAISYRPGTCKSGEKK